MVTSRTTSPAFYEEMIRLLEAEVETLREAIHCYVAAVFRDLENEEAIHEAGKELLEALDGTPSVEEDTK